MMTRLAEVYDATSRSHSRRLLLGITLFLTGSLMILIAIIISTTNLLSLIGIDVFGSRKIAGILAGLGIPAVFIGIIRILPVDPFEKAATAIGSSIALFGVILFWIVYPDQWFGATSNHYTFPVVSIYFIGTIISFWAVFSAGMNFKIRNDPGGTIRFDSSSDSNSWIPPTSIVRNTVKGYGGIGVIGTVDRSPSTHDNSGTESVPASDGGTATTHSPSPTQVSRGMKSSPDVYCGNCLYFDYARSSSGLKPYCAYHGNEMEDMVACDHYQFIKVDN